MTWARPGLLVGPGLVAPWAGFPTWLAQIGFENPMAEPLLSAGLAVDPLLAWPGRVCPVDTHLLLVVVVVWAGSWPVVLLGSFGRLLGCPPSKPAVVSAAAS